MSTAIVDRPMPSERSNARLSEADKARVKNMCVGECIYAEDHASARCIIAMMRHLGWRPRQRKDGGFYIWRVS